jgi:hypothetical protein
LDFSKHKRVRRDFDEAAQHQYALDESGGPWPEHVPQDVVLDLSEQYAEQYAQLDDGAFTAEGARVGALLAGPGGAGLCDADRGGPTAEALDTLARAIALGSIVTGGIKVWGIHATWN